MDNFRPFDETREQTIEGAIKLMAENGYCSLNFCATTEEIERITAANIQDGYCLGGNNEFTVIVQEKSDA